MSNWLPTIVLSSPLILKFQLILNHQAGSMVPIHWMTEAVKFVPLRNWWVGPPFIMGSLLILAVLIFSWKCSRHILGTGTPPKISLMKLDGQPYFLQNLLSHMPAACPWSQSHVLSSTWNQKIVNQSNL